MYDLDTIGETSIFKLIRRAVALVRISIVDFFSVFVPRSRAAQEK